jgi:8-oxo-dGTP pyrophosphatase MutT (NUDIX family)
MDKFTQAVKKETTLANRGGGEKYAGDFMKITGYKDWDVVSHPDSVIILPYIKDEGYILLRLEPIPTYEFKYKSTEHPEFKNTTTYLTVISGVIDPGESPIQTIRRELYEEAGLLLSSMYQIEVEKNLFMSKGTTAQYYTCLMELNFNDYRFTTPIGDGSQLEKMAKTIKLDMKYLDDVRTFDLITEYMLLKLKYEYNVK